MTDNIENATEVASERPTWELRAIHLIGDDAENFIQQVKHHFSTRIPPQGEQPTDDGMMRVDRETLVEMYEYFTMHTDEDAIVFGSTLKLILGDHHE